MSAGERDFAFPWFGGENVLIVFLVLSSGYYGMFLGDRVEVSFMCFRILEIIKQIFLKERLMSLNI